MWKSFWISTPRQNLQKTKDNVNQHIQDFKNEAAACIQKRTTQLRYELAKNLPVLTSSDANHTQRDDEGGVKFPIRTGVPTRNHTFVGRDGTLRDMNTNLPRTSCSPACCALYNIATPGCGSSNGAAPTTAGQVSQRWVCARCSNRDDPARNPEKCNACRAVRGSRK